MQFSTFSRETWSISKIITKSCICVLIIWVKKKKKKKSPLKFHWWQNVCPGAVWNTAPEISNWYIYIYIYIYIYKGRSIKKVDFAKESEIESGVYSCTFLREINWDRAFHVTEDCQHDLLNWRLCLELFLYQKVSVFQFHWLSFDLG